MARCAETCAAPVRQTRGRTLRGHAADTQVHRGAGHRRRARRADPGLLRLPPRARRVRPPDARARRRRSAARSRAASPTCGRATARPRRASSSTTATSQERAHPARWVWLDAQGRDDAPRVRATSSSRCADGEVVTISDHDARPRCSRTSRSSVPGADRERRPRDRAVVRAARQLHRAIRCATRSSARRARSRSPRSLALVLGVVFIGRPISRLAAKARRVGTGDLDGPAPARAARRARRARDRDQPDVRAARRGARRARARDRAAAPRRSAHHRRQARVGPRARARHAAQRRRRAARS